MADPLFFTITIEVLVFAGILAVGSEFVRITLGILGFAVAFVGALTMRRMELRPIAASLS